MLSCSRRRVSLVEAITPRIAGASPAPQSKTTESGSLASNSRHDSVTQPNKSPSPCGRGQGRGRVANEPSPPPNLPHRGGGIVCLARASIAPRDWPMHSTSTRIASLERRSPFTEIRDEPTGLGVERPVSYWHPLPARRRSSSKRTYKNFKCSSAAGKRGRTVHLKPGWAARIFANGAIDSSNCYSSSPVTTKECLPFPGPS